MNSLEINAPPCYPVPMDLEERIIQLETRMAYYEKTIEDLNQVVTKQQEQFDLQQKVLQVLKEKYRSLKEELQDNELVEKRPPHY